MTSRRTYASASVRRQERRRRARRSTSTGITLTGADAGNYTSSTPRQRPAPTSRRGRAARDRHGRQQGLRRHRRGDTSTWPPTGRRRRRHRRLHQRHLRQQERRHRKAGHRHRDLDHRRRRRQLHVQHDRPRRPPDITPQDLTVTATGNNKVYDGTTAATVTLSTDKVAGDVVTPNYTSATFNDKNVGTAKPVSVTGISITGADAANYTLQHDGHDTADITSRDLHVTATGDNKVYDGTNAATVTLSTDKVVGDLVTPNYTSATFNNKNVGTAKTVSVSGISITGADAGNYTLSTPRPRPRPTSRPGPWR